MFCDRLCLLGSKEHAGIIYDCFKWIVRPNAWVVGIHAVSVSEISAIKNTRHDGDAMLGGIAYDIVQLC